MVNVPAPPSSPRRVPLRRWTPHGRPHPPPCHRYGDCPGWGVTPRDPCPTRLAAPDPPISVFSAFSARKGRKPCVPRKEGSQAASSLVPPDFRRARCAYFPPARECVFGVDCDAPGPGAYNPHSPDSEAADTSCLPLLAALRQRRGRSLRGSLPLAALQRPLLHNPPLSPGSRLSSRESGRGPGCHAQVSPARPSRPVGAGYTAFAGGNLDRAEWLRDSCPQRSARGAPEGGWGQVSPERPHVFDSGSNPWVAFTFNKKFKRQLRRAQARQVRRRRGRADSSSAATDAEQPSPRLSLPLTAR
eukprot:TRINITY_DN2221_c2_g1_i1.p1 TRINITY_DN2221_c2_g1~~TRINITY_DN2221_c2_g1_i1.p1  ORF type:complete len:302 (+),score=75.96 TRINITY_DN2221_c2_g1_i1:48-953(+)